MSKRIRNPQQTILSLVDFEAHEDCVKAVVDTSRSIRTPTTIGIKFVSPEHVMDFITALMDKAAVVWPEHPVIKMYLEEE